MSDLVTCPSCGGAGGGPFGRAGSAWDTEEFVCPRCKGAGALSPEELIATTVRPGIAKSTVKVAAAADKKKTGTTGSCTVSDLAPVPGASAPPPPRFTCADFTCPASFQCEVEESTGAVGCVEQRTCVDKPSGGGGGGGGRRGGGH